MEAPWEVRTAFIFILFIFQSIEQWW